MNCIFKKMSSRQSKYNCMPMFRRYRATQHSMEEGEEKKRVGGNSHRAVVRRRDTPLPFALYERPLFFNAVSHGLSCGVISNGVARADTEGGQMLTKYAIWQYKHIVLWRYHSIAPSLSSYKSTKSHDPARRNHRRAALLVSLKLPTIKSSTPSSATATEATTTKKKQL